MSDKINDIEEYIKAELKICDMENERACGGDCDYIQGKRWVLDSIKKILE